MLLLCLQFSPFLLSYLVRWQYILDDSEFRVARRESYCQIEMNEENDASK